MEILPLPDTNEVKASKCAFHRVLKVIDGDTFVIPDGTKVRLIGVDTPETLDPRKEVQWFGKEAAKTSREWLEGRIVCLRQDRDKTQDIDKYGRLLRYVWKYADEEQAINDHKGLNGFFVNAELIKQGYGFAYTRFPFQHMEDFRGYERLARENNRGLWDKEKQTQWEEEFENNKAFAKTCGEEDTICPEDAINTIGKYKIVRFFVEKSHDSGNAVFLNSKNNYTDHDNFTAVIFKNDKKNFSTHPADYYWGKTIDVKGMIKEYNGRAEVILKDISQIEIIR